MEKKNVTLRLPVPLMVKFRALAARRKVPMSKMMEDAISEMVIEDNDPRILRAGGKYHTLRDSIYRR